ESLPAGRGRGVELLVQPGRGIGQPRQRLLTIAALVDVPFDALPIRVGQGFVEQAFQLFGSWVGIHVKSQKEFIVHHSSFFSLLLAASPAPGVWRQTRRTRSCSIGSPFPRRSCP